MRGKRSKQYRKLMEQYCRTFGFREPYQVLVDAEMVEDACRFKMDLAAALERTVHGTVKPMITQCEIRKLYQRKNEPGVDEAIEVAKKYERRRCGHHPDEYPTPLGTLECLGAVVDAKGRSENKHRYVVASQSQQVRRMLRGVRAVPLIYIKRSVMVLEPMADESAEALMREEKAKFRAELKKRTTKKIGGKRKREEKEDGDGDESDDDDDGGAKLANGGSEGGGGAKLANGGSADEAAAAETKKRKNRGGPKQPNPLSMKKSKKQRQRDEEEEERRRKKLLLLAMATAETTDKPKRKRRRKTKASASATGDEVNDGDENGDAGEGGS